MGRCRHLLIDLEDTAIILTIHLYIQACLIVHDVPCMVPNDRIVFLFVITVLVLHVIFTAFILFLFRYIIYAPLS